MAKLQLDYIDLKYTPKKSDVVTELYIEPNKMSLEAASQHAAAESSIGTWTGVGTMKRYAAKLRPRVFSINKRTKALWGTYRVLLNNMVKGVSEGFEKVLEYEGIGYRAEVKNDASQPSGQVLELNVGFSHSVRVSAPAGVSFKTEKKTIFVLGIDKELVGQVAARIRKVRPPEPYKGKGIRYKGEVILRKAGKKAVTAG